MGAGASSNLLEGIVDIYARAALTLSEEHRQRILQARCLENALGELAAAGEVLTTPQSRRLDALLNQALRIQKDASRQNSVRGADSASPRRGEGINDGSAKEQTATSWWQYRPPAGSRQPKVILEAPGSAPAENCAQIYPFYTFQAFDDDAEDPTYLRLADDKGWVEASHCERHRPDPTVNDQQVADELAGKGFSIRQLLKFWREHAVNPGDWTGGETRPPATGNWLGQITRSTTTNELVRNLVIPQTADRMTSYMDSDFMQSVGGPKKATILVSHWWGNSFYNDILCILEHATKLSGFMLDLLINHAKIDELESGSYFGFVLPDGFLDQAYWMCIFAVNQHVAICGTKWNPCQCTAAKYATGHPSCQMDKFDSVMGEMPDGLVAALDTLLITLKRCWCVSEVGKCLEKALKITYLLPGKLTAPSLELQSVVDCEATLPADKDRILQQIVSTVGIAAFDKSVRRSIGPTLHRIALLQAVEEGDDVKVRSLLSKRGDVNTANGAGQTCLRLAVDRNHADVMRTLLAERAEVDKAAGDGNTPFLYAVQEGRLEVVQALLTAGADKDFADNDGITPLFMAAQEGHLKVVQALLEAAAGKDLAKNTGSTPLFIAAQEGNLEVVQALLEAGAAKDLAQNDGATPLLVAAQEGHLEVVQALLDASATKDLAMNDGASPLWNAARTGHLEVVQALLEAGADKDLAKNTGSTPLFMAAQEGHLEVVQALLEADANKDLAMNDGATPLHIAALKGHLAVVRALLEAGANKGLAWSGGQTPLFFAAQEGHLEVVQALLEAGADKGLALNDGTTPLDIAARNGHLEVVQAFSE